MTAPEPHLDTTDRASLIRWLIWNDPNGCWTDEDCDLEGLPRLTTESAAEHVRQMLAEEGR